LKLRQILVDAVAKNPYAGKKLVGDLKGFYSVRLTLKDRIVYTTDENARIAFVHRARTHYGE
jgi:Txe/YoeB family toxin of Txe-Axe toxin-antitoxin module